MLFKELFSQIEIYVFCKNIRGMIIAYWFKKIGVIVTLLDNDVNKQNSETIGYKCIAPNDAQKDIPCVIAAESKKNKEIIKEQLKSIGVKYIVEIDEDWEKEWLSGYAPWISDEEYLKLFYEATVGDNIDINHPRNFNEKIQWLKINDRNPLYKKLTDKYEVKKYVSEKIGSRYVIPTIGIYDLFEKIDINGLPNDFVMKCTHDSGSTIVCYDKSKFDFELAKKKMEKALSSDYYYYEREYSYKNIKPRIIVEKCIVNQGEDLKDYKIFCFDGSPKLVEVDWGRWTEHKRNIYTPEWEYIDASIKYPNDPLYIIKKPEALNEMLSIAQELSKGFIHVRVDLYYTNRQIYFGEMTFYHGGGYERFTPNKLNVDIGEYISVI